MQARVKRITGDVAELENHKKYRVTDTGLQEVPLTDNGMASLKVAYLERPLTDRLEALLQFVSDLSGVKREAQPEKRAV